VIQPGLGSSVVVSGSSEADSEGGEGSAWVAGVAAQGGSEVDRPRPAEHPSREVAQDRHDVWRGAGADLGGVFTEADVADVAQRLDLSMPAQQVSKPGGAGQVEREAGDRIDGHGLPPPRRGVQVAGPAG
jgi:hypothetical protein